MQTNHLRQIQGKLAANAVPSDSDETALVPHGVVLTSFHQLDRYRSGGRLRRLEMTHTGTRTKIHAQTKI